MPLTAATDFALTPVTIGEHTLREPLEASARPFQGGASGLAADGFARPLVAGDPLLGFAEQTLNLEDLRATDGAQTLNHRCGLMDAETTLDATRADVVARRNVYLTEDGTFSFTASNNSLAGHLIGLTAAGKAVVRIVPHRHRPDGIGTGGIKTLAATGNETLDLRDLNKVILVPNTGAKTVTLPPVLRCAGKFLTFKKTTADAQPVTLDGDGAETIDGGATYGVIDAANDTVTIFCTGTAWVVVARHIA